MLRNFAHFWSYGDENWTQVVKLKNKMIGERINSIS